MCDEMDGRLDCVALSQELTVGVVNFYFTGRLVGDVESVVRPEHSTNRMLLLALCGILKTSRSGNRRCGRLTQIAKTRGHKSSGQKIPVRGKRGSEGRGRCRLTVQRDLQTGDHVRILAGDVAVSRRVKRQIKRMQYTLAGFRRYELAGEFVTRVCTLEGEHAVLRSVGVDYIQIF